MPSNYTPFPGKKREDLRASDLVALRDVAEGWYVEYKRALPNAKSIAKSVSAFANTYGGWLFYGVQEKNKTDSVAENCPGIARADLDAALQSIRHACASLLNPTPHFDVQVVWGPDPTMHLAEDHAVVCIEIPFSTFAPHIHSSGAIYRRVADGSDPIAETDRHQLDLLFNRRDKINLDYKNWIERAPERSEREAGHPYLRLLLEADLYRASGKSWDLTVSQVREALNAPASGVLIPLESVYPSSIGIVARQTSSLHSHEAFGLTWIVGRGLRCEIWLPVNTHSVNDPDHLRVHLGQYQHSEEFIADLKAARVGSARILDLNQIFNLLVIASAMYLNLLDKAGVSADKIHAKALLGDVWRCIPFLDTATMLDRARTSGLPLTLTDEAMVPSGTDAESFAEIPLDFDESERLLGPVLFAAWLFELICRALGLEGIMMENEHDKAHPLILELFEAAKRSRSASDEVDPS